MRRLFPLFLIVITAWGQALEITERPLSRVLLQGESVGISIASTGAGPLSYSWQHNGSVLGETTSTLQLDNVSPEDRGWYHVTVSNATEELTSVFYLGVAIPNPTYVSWGEYAVTFPDPLNNIAELATGFDSLTVLALRSDGTVLSSGSNSQGQGDVPVDLASAVRIATNTNRSAAVTASGQLIEWPARGEIPANLSDVVDVKIGYNYGLALKADGTVVSWGDNWSGQRNLPDNLSDVVALAAGRGHGAVLLSDGTVRTWGGAGDGSSSIPVGLDEVISLVSGGSYLMALRKDGSVVAWGNDYNGSATVPADLPPVSAITSGANFNVAIHSDGRVSAFGSNYNTETDLPQFLSGAVQVVAGVRFGGALLESAPPQIATPPTSQNLTAGDDLTLSVEPSGSLYFSYQWYRDNEAITDGNGTQGANTNELYIRQIDATQAGLYTVMVTNAIGAVTSPATAVTVAIPPSITSRPLSQLVGLGTDATFSISVAENNGVTYAWKHNSQTITGEENSSLSLTNFTSDDSGYYEVIVSNTEASASSVFNVFPAPMSAEQSAVVTWGDDPSQPQSTVLSQRSDIVKLAVSEYQILALTNTGEVISLRGDLVPSGLANVVDIANGTYSAALTADGRIHTWGSKSDWDWSPTERLTNVSALHANEGSLVIVKSDGSIQSHPNQSTTHVTGAVKAVAGFGGPHALLPDGTIVFPGEEPPYSVYDFRPRPENLTNIVDLDAASWHYLALHGDGTVTAWGRNNLGQSDVPRGLDNVMRVEAAGRLSFTLHNDGSVTGWGYNPNYNLKSPHRLGSVLSLDASENIHAAIIAVGPPQTLQSPTNTSVNTGDSLVLSAKIVSGVPATYQWFKDNEAIPGATDLSLHLDAPTANDNGSYSLRASNAYGTATSVAAQVSIVAPVTISDRPLSRMVPVGASTTFTITASGQGSLQYAWRHDGQPIPGANGSSLELTNVTRADRGRYTVMVTDESGGTALSVAYLEVAPPIGGVLSWGYHNSAPPPAPFNYVAIDASASSGAALRADGTVAGWGDSVSSPPTNLSGVVAIARGDAHTIALKIDGTVTVWGSYGYSETAVPAGLDEVVAVAASGYNSIALRADGTVVRWGYDSNSQQVIPANLNHVVSIAAGRFHGIALHYDGSITTWGKTLIDSPVDIVRIAAGSEKTAMERADGTVETWQERLESTHSSSGLRSLSVGSNLALMLENDNTLKTVGTYEVDPVIFTTNDILDVAVGNSFYALLVADEPSAPEIITPPADQTTPYGTSVTFDVEVSGSPPFTFRWLKDGTPITNFSSTSPLVLTDVTEVNAGLYSIEIRNGFGRATSATAALTIETTRVTATTPPVVGGSVTLTVNAPDATGYQWRYRGVPIVGATESNLTLNPLSRAQNGDYDVVLSTTTGERVAHSYRLNVTPSQNPDIMVVDTQFSALFEREGQGDIRAIQKLADGSFLIGGDFIKIGGSHRFFLAKLKADGTVDESYNPPRLNGPVNTFQLATDGSIYVAGEFTSADGQPHGRLLRLGPTLELDPSFAVGSGFDADVHALAIDADGNLIVGGSFGSYQYQNTATAIRLNNDASLQHALGQYTNLENVFTIRVLADGRLLLGGGKNSHNGFVVRLTAEGSRDDSWNSGRGPLSVNSLVGAIHDTPDGNWIIQGTNQPDSTESNSVVLRKLTPDGTWGPDFSLDATFETVSSSLTFSHVLADGRILISGPSIPLALLNADGSINPTGPTLPWKKAFLRTATLDDGGNLRLWARAQATSNSPHLLGSAVFTADLSAISSFQGQPVRAEAEVFQLQQVGPDAVLLRGNFTHVNGVDRPGLVRLSGSGLVNQSFACDIPLSSIDSGPFVIDGNNRIVLHDGTRIRRLNSDGRVDNSFNPVATHPGALAIDPQGSILFSNRGFDGAEGYFGETRVVRRLLDDGSIDPVFAPDFSGTATSIFPQSNGRIVLGGYFSQFAGNTVSGPQRIQADGSWDPSYRLGNYSYLKLQAGLQDELFLLVDHWAGSVYRFQGSGELYPDFNDINQPQAQSILPLPDGKFLRAGRIVDNQSASPNPLITRHLATGQLDEAFLVDGLNSRENDLQEMLLLDDGSIWLTGKNLSAQGQPRNGLVRLRAAQILNITTSPASPIAAPGDSVTLQVIAEGEGPITYQWYRNRVAITGATHPSLQLTGVGLQDVANYHVVVTNPFATITTDTVTLVGPNPAPIITTQPASVITPAGHAATLSVSATGVGALTYQWRKSGHPIPNANAASFVIPHALRSDAGLYDVIVADGLSTVTSNGVRIDVSPTSYPATLAIDPSFAPRFEAAGGEINTILPAPGGKFIATGDFTSLNGVASPGIARVDANFQIDRSFNPPDLFGHVGSSFAFQLAQTRVMAIQPDGKLLVLHALPGDSVSAHRNTLKRLLPDGSIDSSFNASNDPVNINDLALQPDGKIIVVGLEISSSPIGDKHYVYRLHPDGSLDVSYTPQFRQQDKIIAPSNVIVQPNGQAVFAGYFDSINDIATNGLTRLDSNGHLDPSFTPSGFTVGYSTSIEIDSSGSIWIGGPVYHSSVGTLNLSRISPDGNWEAGWGSSQGISRAVASIQFGSDGKTWAAQRPSSNTARTSRISAADLVEQTFESYHLGDSVAFVPRADGGLWMTGSVVQQPGPAVREFAADGTRRNFFVDTMVSAGVTTLAQAPDGSFYAAGDFTRVNDVPSGRIARLFSNGELDLSFKAPIGFDSPPTDLEPLPNGQLFVGGHFNHYEGEPVAELVRLNTDGTYDSTFAAAEPTNSSTWFKSPMALLSDGRLLVRADRCFLPDGSFDPTHSLSYSNSLGIHALPDGEALLALSTDAIGSFNITRVDATGSQLEVSYAGHTFSSFAVDPLGHILTGSRYQNNLQNLVKRMLPDLSRDDSFVVTDLPGPIYNTSAYTGPTLLVQEDGRVIVNDLNGMWRLNLDGTRDTSFAQEILTEIGGTRNTASAAMLLLDDGRLLIADQEMQANGLRHRGIVALHSVDGPTINQQPASQSLVVGETLTLSASLADSSGLIFQWSKDGFPIANATTLEFRLNELQLSDAGQYTLAITGPSGTTHSAAAEVTVSPSVAPQIQLQPRDQSGEIGESISFRINATGRPTPTFQWRHNGQELPGEISSTLRLENLTPEAVGAYTVVVTNFAGSVTSEAAQLNLFPSGTTARQELTDTELGSTLATVTITNTFTAGEPLPHLDWQVLLPSGWSLQSTTGDTEATRPTIGDTDLLEWSWSAIPASPLIFSYTLAGTLTGNPEPEIATLLTIGTDENARQYLAQPDPLVFRFRHSADTNQDGKLSLSELLRVIELYNTRFGTNRTGRYRVQPDSSDGFATDPTVPGDTPAAHSRYHAADTDRNGKLSLGELLRVIELYNTRTGTSRTGRYRIQPDTPDGFAPSP